MPTPPTVTRDYITVGGAQATISLNKTLWTWGQARVPVVAAPHGSGGAGGFWDNQGHNYDYYNNGINGIEAVDAEGRLFRGQPFSVVGYNDYATSASDERFFFGGFYESPPGSGNFVPGIGTGLDKEEEGLILEYASFVGSGQTIGVEPEAYDGSDPDGQNIGGTPLGTVSSVTLSF